MKSDKQILNFLFKRLNRSNALAELENPYKADFLECAIIDSVEFFKFVLELEVEFDIQFSDEELLEKDFKNINGLCKIISKKLS